MESLRKFFDDKSILSDEDWTLFQNILELKVFKKGTYVLNFNTICNTIWYLKTGFVRKIILSENDYKTTHFFSAPDIFTVYESLTTKKPSQLALICETNVEVVSIPYQKVLKLYDSCKSLESLSRVLLESYFVKEFELRRTFLNMNASERYVYLEKTRPEVFQNFQLKDIATYIGITPVSLSRLRKSRWNS